MHPTPGVPPVADDVTKSPVLLWLAPPWPLSPPDPPALELVEEVLSPVAEHATARESEMRSKEGRR